MSDKTTRAVVLAALVLASGATVAVGASGTAPDATQTVRDAAVQEPVSLQGQDGSVNARNVTVDALVLRNVTITNAQFERLTVRSASADGENVTNRTYENVSVESVEANGTLTDATFDNLSIRSEELATEFLDESGTVEARLVLDQAVLNETTIDGLVVQNATVESSSVEGLSLQDEGAQETAGEETTAEGENGTATTAADDGADPAMTAESVVVEGGDLTDLSVTGVSLGASENATAEDGTDEADAPETTPAGDETDSQEETTEAADDEAETTTAADE